jgi:hypothetical protein
MTSNSADAETIDSPKELPQNQENIMLQKLVRQFSALLMLALPAPALASTVTGKIVSIEGHIFPACRVLVIRKDDGALAQFRIPDTGADNSILAVGMMAFSANMKILLSYSDGGTTGCGTEPKVEYLRAVRD